jgi:hypothetical protein
MNNEIKCPCCDSILVVTHQDRYQDTLEHVSQPNATPSMKDGYQCPNEECLAHICGTTWLEDGDYFTGKRPENITRGELFQALEGKHGTAYAVGSWNFNYELGKRSIKKRTWKINLRWYKINIIPKEKGWDYPEEERHQPHFWKKKIEIWKKESEYSYVNVIPFWKMASFCVRKFKTSYASWKVNGNRRDFEEAYNEAMGISPWGSIDDRFYAKVTKWWIQIFYHNRVKELINEKNC